MGGFVARPIMRDGHTTARGSRPRSPVRRRSGPLRCERPANLSRRNDRTRSKASPWSGICSRVHASGRRRHPYTIVMGRRARTGPNVPRSAGRRERLGQYSCARRNAVLRGSTRWSRGRAAPVSRKVVTGRCSLAHHSPSSASSRGALANGPAGASATQWPGAGKRANAFDQFFASQFFPSIVSFPKQQAGDQTATRWWLLASTRSARRSCHPFASGSFQLAGGRRGTT